MEQEDTIARVRRAFNLLLRRQGNSGPLTGKRAFLKWVVMTRTRSVVIPCLQRLILNARITPSKALNILMMSSSQDPNQVLLEKIHQICIDRLESSLVALSDAANISYPLRFFVKGITSKLRSSLNKLRDNRDHHASSRGFEILSKILELQPNTAYGLGLRKISVESGKNLAKRNMSAIRLANSVASAKRNRLKDAFTQIVRVTDRRIVLANEMLAAITRFTHEKRLRPAINKMRLQANSKQLATASFVTILEKLVSRSNSGNSQRGFRSIDQYVRARTTLARALILPCQSKISLGFQRMRNFRHFAREKQKSIASAVEILGWCIKKRLTIAMGKLRNSTTRFKILLGKLVRWRRWRALMRLAKTTNAWKTLASVNHQRRTKAFKKLFTLFAEKKRQIWQRVSQEQLQQQYRRSFSSEWSKRWENRLKRATSQQNMVVKQFVSKKLSSSRALGIIVRLFSIQERIGFLSIKHYGQFRKLLAMRANERACSTKTVINDIQKIAKSSSKLKTVRLLYYARMHRVLSGIILCKKQSVLDKLKKDCEPQSNKLWEHTLRGPVPKTSPPTCPSFVLHLGQVSTPIPNRKTSAPYLQFSKTVQSSFARSRITDAQSDYEGALRQLGARSLSDATKRLSVNQSSTAHSLRKSGSKPRSSLLLETFASEGWSGPRTTSHSFFRSTALYTDRVRIDLSPAQYGRSFLLPAGT